MKRLPRRLALAAPAALLVSLSAHGGRADESARFDCHGQQVPKDRAGCENRLEVLDGYQSFTCGNTRNQDEVTYCGAVYGYERDWCARIGNERLRSECWSRTE